ncbi:uncharacterized protein LOC116018773 [Ipomoea triloba]|uniref:uncharacterized protein LOC116018773 n=1 Tax=Ipomoea triloba TaxID=35885 RepID=UPI00125CF08D|nr:uncharacterized protein LOC116018773 [Ipomoea triloba]
MKLAFLLCVFMAASLLASSSSARLGEGTERKQLFMTGQLCRSHQDCKANSLYTGNFCINKISESEIGHCVGFGSTLETEQENSKCKKEKHKKKKKQKKSKAKPSGCGKCETDDDCRGCPAAAACEKIILDGMCA